MAGSQSAWGLDIGATALKSVKVRRDGDRVEIEAFDVIEHDKFLTEPDIDRDSIVRTSIQKFIDRNSPKGETVIISVPGSKTFARFVKLPPVEPKKIPDIVKFEAIQQIPFPLEQVNWDYQTFQNPESPEVEVGIFAMKQDLVSQELMNFTTLKMSVQGVQLAPLGLYNAAAFDEWTDGKGTVLVDIGAEHTDLVIVDQGRIWLRTINLGGNHFTEALAKAFKQPFSRAEQLKKGAATSKYQKQIFQAMRPIFADLVAEISRSLGHYQTSHRDSHLERIIAMGNPFKLPNLQKYIQQELKMEVVRLENFKKAKVDSKLAAGLQENILSLGVAYGLGLQGLDWAAIDTNLLPVSIAREMIWQKKRMWFAGAAAVLLAGCAFWTYTTFKEKWDFEKSQQLKDAKWNDVPLAQADDTSRGKGQTIITDYIKTNSNFSNNRREVEQYISSTDYRKVVPEIYEGIYACLPQKGLMQPGGPYPARHMFAGILSLNCYYKIKLSEQFPFPFSDETAPGVTAAPAPAATPAPAPAPGASGVAPPSAEDLKDRGFVIDVKYFTPSGTAPLEDPTEVIRAFTDNLKRYEPLGKSFKFTVTKYTREPINNASQLGARPGGAAQSFSALFVPKQMGLPEPKVIPGAVPGANPAGLEAQLPNYPVDAILARPTEAGKPSQQPPSMVGYFIYSFKIKAHLK